MAMLNNKNNRALQPFSYQLYIQILSLYHERLSITLPLYTIINSLLTFLFNTLPVLSFFSLGILYIEHKYK